MKKDNKKKKGFTLIELLAVIVVLGVVVSVSIYVSVSLIDDKKAKVKVINTEAEYKSVLAYATEFKKSDDYQSYNFTDGNYKYVCIKRKDLVDKGFLSGDKFSKEELDKKILVVKNVNDAYISYNEYSGSLINENYCNVENTNITISSSTTRSPYSDGTWYNSNVVATIKVVSDRNNTVTRFRYGIGSSLNNTAYIRDNNGTKNFTIDKEGTNVLNVEVGDNLNKASATYKVDKTSPKINKVDVLSISSSAVKLKLDCNDKVSGVYKIAVTTKNVLPAFSQFYNYNTDINGSITIKNVNISGNELYVYIIDRAGNYTSYKTVTDKEKPTVKVDLDFSEKNECSYPYRTWRRQKRLGTISFSDNVALKSYEIQTYSNGSYSTVASGTFDDGIKTKTMDYYFLKGGSRVYVTDKAGNQSYYYVYNYDIDDEGPELDYSSSNFDFDSYSGGYSYSFNIYWYDDTADYVDSYFKITTSSSKPKSGWKDFSYEYDNLSSGEKYYLYIKLVDACGNASVYRYASFYLDYDDGGGGSSGGNDDDDCHKVCLMKKNSDSWWDYSYSDSSNKTRLHAINSVIAGNLSFSNQVSYNVLQGTWYYSGSRLYDWYDWNCPNTTCGSSELSGPAYSNDHVYGVSACSNDDPKYVSGSCGSGAEVCYCCEIGTGFYKGSCYGSYIDNS